MSDSRTEQDFYMFTLNGLGIEFEDKKLILTKSQKVLSFLIWILLATILFLNGNYLRLSGGDLEKITGGFSLFIVAFMSNIKTLTFFSRKKPFTILCKSQKKLKL